MTVDPRKFTVALARSGLNIQGVAAYACVHRQTVRNVAQGKEARPDTVGRIAKALGVDVETIMASGP